MQEGKKTFFDKIQANRPERIFFRDEYNEGAIFEATEKLANMIEKEGYENLVFLDASARPMAYALSTYWHKAKAGTKLPNIYFLNPEGFHRIPKGARIEQARLDSELLGIDPDITQVLVDTDSMMEKTGRLAKVHHNLFENRSKPTAVIDSCIHTGGAARTAITALSKLGVSNIKLVAAFSDPDSIVTKADHYLLDYTPDLGCYTFGPEGLVDKGTDVVAEPHTYPNAIATGRQLREEIKDIIESRLP